MLISQGVLGTVLLLSFQLYPIVLYPRHLGFVIVAYMAAPECFPPLCSYMELPYVALLYVSLEDFFTSPLGHWILMMLLCWLLWIGLAD